MSPDEIANEVIPRHVPSNPYNYTNLQLAERKHALKLLEREYPHLPFGWIEMCYDFEYNTPKEEIDKIINEGLWESGGREHPTFKDKEDKEDKSHTKSKTLTFGEV